MDDLGGRNIPAKRKRSGPVYEQCLKILRGIMKLKIAGDFLTPVDYKALQLFDYPQIIAHPMDLGTVMHKLQSGVYENATQLKADVELIFSNCAKYNGPDHPIAINGFQILDNFNKKYAELKSFSFDASDESLRGPKGPKGALPQQKKVRPAGGPALANSAPVVDFTFEEKRQLCILINNLDQKYLPQVIHIIHKYAPSLLDTDAAQAAGGEEIEISVDNLQPGVLRELDSLIKSIRHPNAGIISSQAPVAPAAQSHQPQPQAPQPAQHFTPQANSTSVDQVNQIQPAENYYTQNYASQTNHTTPVESKPAEIQGAGTPMDISHQTEHAAAVPAGGDGTDAFMSIQ